jgi:hypothetical protein
MPNHRNIIADRLPPMERHAERANRSSCRSHESPRPEHGRRADPNGGRRGVKRALKRHSGDRIQFDKDEFVSGVGFRTKKWWRRETNSNEAEGRDTKRGARYPAGGWSVGTDARDVTIAHIAPLRSAPSPLSRQGNEPSVRSTSS